MQKAIKLNQPLAEQLWATNNHDAQVLATLIADPQAISDKQLEDWAKSLSNYGITENVFAVCRQDAARAQEGGEMEQVEGRVRADRPVELDCGWRATIRRCQMITSSRI
jgi:hypothetical protein